MNEKMINKRENKISIITIFLWIFLIVTMLTITFRATKNTNALEESGITMKLSMYDKSDPKSNTPVDKIVWEKTWENFSYEDTVALIKVAFDGYSPKDYQPGELKITLSSSVKFIAQLEVGDINPNWELVGDLIVNKYEIKKGQKIFGTLQWITTPYIIGNSYEFGKSGYISAYMFDIDEDISVSNSCYLELKLSFKNLAESKIYDLNYISYWDWMDNGPNEYYTPEMGLRLQGSFHGQEARWIPKINYTRDSSKEYDYDGEDIEIVNDFIYLVNSRNGRAFCLGEEDYNFTIVKISDSMRDLNFSIYVKGREDEDYRLYKNSLDISGGYVNIEDEDIIKVKILIEDVKEINIEEEDLVVVANIHIQDNDKYNTLTLTELLDIGYIRIYDDFKSGITINNEYIDLPILYTTNSGGRDFEWCYNRELNRKLEEYDKLNFGEKLDRKEINTYNHGYISEENGYFEEFYGTEIGCKSDKVEKNISRGITIKNKAIIDFRSDKKSKEDMILKIYNTLDTVGVYNNYEREIKSSFVIKDSNNQNVENLEEIINNLEINVTRENNGEGRINKIEVIIDCNLLKDLEANNKFDIEFEYSASSYSDDVASVKKYIMWEQQDTYSYSWKYAVYSNLGRYGDYDGMLISDIEDIDNDGDRNELVICVNEYFWLYSLNSISISKYWKDNNDEMKIRPDNIIAELKANGEVIGEYELNKDNNWYKEVDVEGFDIDGKPIEYTVDEKYEVPGYEKRISGTTIINERKDLAQIEIPVEKIWEDENNKYGKRDESVIVQLKDGEKVVEEVKLTEENNWKYIFTGIKKYREDGSIIEYFIDEKETNKYYEKTKDGYKIINKYIGNEETEKNEEKEDKSDNAKIEDNVNTSDINIILYLSIFIVAIILVVIIVIFIKKSKNKIEKQ